MDREYLSCAETAKLLRGALKAEFGGVKFSVRSDTYAGGASIRVRWVDGPTEEAVKRVCGLYEGATFDGMIDLKSYHDSILVDEDGNPRTVSFGADYIFENRDLSEELLSRLESWVTENGTFGSSRTSNCGACNRWAQPEDPCWTAPRNGSVVFVCSPRCGARVTACYVDARELEDVAS